MEVQVITQHFRLKRLKEYLPTLTRSVKWHEDDVSIKVDNLVLLQDGVKHEFWPSGRIEKVHCRQDGIVCVVDVCKKIRAYVRPAMKKKIEGCFIDEVPQGEGNVAESTSDSRS